MYLLDRVVRNIVISYDADMKRSHGSGWSVELQPTPATHYFATFGDAMMFITDNSWHFLPSIHEVGSNDNQSL